MRAVVRRGARFEDEDMAEPVPGEGQVILRTLMCGICGSDVHMHQHIDRVAAMAKRRGRQPLDSRRDVVFGHEFCGEIVDYGPGTQRRLKTGTRVVALPYATGPDGVETVGYSNRFPGGFAERICVDETMLVEVPAGLSDAQAAMTEPFAVGAHAVERAMLDRDSVALVLGCGPVGLAVVAALKVRGFGPIIASDFSPARRHAALQLGADAIVDPAKESPHRWSQFGVPISVLEGEIARAAGRRVANAVVFECVGIPGMVQSIIEGVQPGAQIVVAGVCMEEDRFEPSFAIGKQVTMRFVSAYTRGEFAQTLRDIAEAHIDASGMASAIVGRSGVAAAFETLKTPDMQVKIMVEASRA